MIPLNNLQARPEGETDIFSTRRRIKISWWWFMLILCPTLVPERRISFSVQRPNQKFFFSCYHSTYLNFCWSHRYARSVSHVKLATTLRLKKKCLKRSQCSTGGGASEGEIKNIWDWIISFSRGISLSTLEKSICLRWSCLSNLQFCIWINNEKMIIRWGHNGENARKT